MTTGEGYRKLFGFVLIIAVSIVLFGQHASAGMTRWVNNNAPSYNPPGSNCVDAGYLTIQDAVNASVPTDVVSVCPGSYNENVLISTKNLRLVSVGGAAVTIVNAAQTFHVFQVLATGVTIHGFTIVPTGFADGDIGINLAVEGTAKAAISNNIFNDGRIGINLGCASNNSTVAYNTLNNQSEAAINIDTCEGSEVGSDENYVHHNSACGGTFAYSIAAGEKSQDNKIVQNTAIYITVAGTGNTVHHNIAEYFNIAAGNTEHHNYLDLDACP